MKLTLVRHTSLQVEPSVCYGQSDVDVAASFMQEASVTRDKIKDIAFDVAYTSPLQRCVKLARAMGLDVIEDHRLKELHFGDWEMSAWDDIPRDYFDEWAQNYGHMAPPNGETFAQLQARGVSFVEEMREQYRQGHVLVVTHGGMIRAMIAYVLNMPLKGLFRFHVDHGSITQLEFCDDIPRISFVNR